ncbi:xanthine dehydrogenase family protein subunit M [Salinigranum rubrum]|uniref:Xanthine dehydrogenase family protein subunit M n=1 Tax=Salinigranum rubrum TaxID=755307 RepID=A0A2I8VEF0_9EURY|nr:xanthine dehydrogenase family protein subunit M [Salinigranum rubrum]AUV80308.1 xanthine dehydrogenase family protein subunit M [Salinigranum rubrum]
MYPAEFDYYRAGSVDEAIDLLGAHEGAELLAGGHGLFPLMKTNEHSPPVLVDIGRVDGLSGVSVDGDTVSVGALTTHAEMAASEILNERATALADAAGELGDFQVRNGGTFGGNVAHADPRSDPPAALLALGGEVHVEGPDGERTMAVDDFFRGAFETALDPGELVTSISVPAHGPGEASAYVRYRNPLSGYALVGVGVALRTDDGRIESARVAATGVLDAPFRLDAVEAALTDSRLDADVVDDAATEAADGLDAEDVQSDVQASGAYRLGVLPTYTRRALSAALDRLD